MSASAEHVFFNSHGICVTNARFIVGTQTYAMASVSSVKIGCKDITPPKTFQSLLLGFGVLVGLAVLGSGASQGYLLLPLGIIALAAWWMSRGKRVLEYSIVLTTTAGESQALKSTNEPDIRVVEKALNDAIVYRG